MNDKKICQQIHYKPNKWQRIVRQSSARFKIIVAGRRAGKTLFVAKDPKVGLVNYVFKKNQKIWIVAPSYDLAERVWEEAVHMFYTDLAPLRKSVSNSRGRQKITTVLGTTIEAKSADDPHSLIGKGLDFLICDEAALIDKKAWEESLRPSLIDRKGKAIFISTPKRKNWFYNLYLKGQRHDNEYSSWHFTSYDNEYVDKDELDKIASEMSELEYKQEIMADFLESFGQFFRNIRDRIKGSFETPDPNHIYYVGVDLGRILDFTVITVMDSVTNHLVYFDRFKEVDWTLQKSRIEAVARRFNNAEIIIDSTGIGDPICQSLRDVGLAVNDFKFTTISKKQILDSLSMMIDQKRITYPEIPELLDELEAFGYFESKTNKVKYGSPPGVHDDCVMSLALSCWHLDKEKKLSVVHKTSEFKKEPLQIINPFHL